MYKDKILKNIEKLKANYDEDKVTAELFNELEIDKDMIESNPKRTLNEKYETYKEEQEKETPEEKEKREKNEKEAKKEKERKEQLDKVSGITPPLDDNTKKALISSSMSLYKENNIDQVVFGEDGGKLTISHYGKITRYDHISKKIGSKDNTGTRKEFPSPLGSHKEALWLSHEENRIKNSYEGQAKFYEPFFVSGTLE